MEKKRRTARQLQQIIANRTGAFVLVSAENRGWAAKALFARHGQRLWPAPRGNPQPLVDRAVRDLNEKYELQP